MTGPGTWLMTLARAWQTQLRAFRRRLEQG